jgi:cytochrome b6-f complex iron-sulfur subunit
MAREKNELPAEHSEPRRSFLTQLWFGLGAVVLAEIVYLVISFLRPRRSTAREGEFGTVIAAGPVESFERGSVTAFPRGRFYLARLEDGGFLAISRKCTHLGCTLPWNETEQKFLCPCHSSAFDIRGSVVRAPAPRALDVFRIVIENNLVTVDTGKRIQRSEFRKEQVTYPA